MRDYHTALSDYIYKYLNMDIFGVKLNCPYWMNKIIQGKVAIRGFLNGKGDAEEIRQEIIRRIKEDGQKNLDTDYIYKLAKRHRIGIDCSGFVYRCLDHLMVNFVSAQHTRLKEILNNDINKINADILTSNIFCQVIKRTIDIRAGDLIRLMGGKHVMIITGVSKNKIEYTHSSKHSNIDGVHLAKVVITSPEDILFKQNWIERTKWNDSFKDKYYHGNSGDGVFRPIYLYDL